MSICTDSTSVWCIKTAILIMQKIAVCAVKTPGDISLLKNKCGVNMKMWFTNWCA